MYDSRKSSYKLPPTTITDRFVSQEARRAKALEEQKRRRAQRFDSSRHLDQFADLNLGISDEEEATDIRTNDAPAVSLGSVAPYTSMLEHEASPSVQPDLVPPQSPESPKSGVTKSKKKRKSRNKHNKWADKCMYAELLEMAADNPWSELPGKSDGLPKDLETRWVAVGPVPVGKRCLAVTHQPPGIPGVVPNTTLRSRLLGKVLIPRFPSVLPPLTVLDCILDSNWRENGILHILDVVRWKGQDISDCEASFRFWWRDTRLTELIQSSPPAAPGDVTQADNQPRYQFPYPVTFSPIPYHTDTTLSTLFTHIIPMARSLRSIPIEVPALLPSPNAMDGSMDVDSSFRLKEPAPLLSVSANVAPDGLLLYVAEASYEAGTSPLSSWIPIIGPGETRESLPPSEGPLDLFQRLVHQRLLWQGSSVSNTGTSVEIDM